MKKQIGNALALYPTPLVVVGTMVRGKPNWVLVGHIGIIGHDRVMVSLAKPHYTNQGVKETRTLSINIVDEAMLKKADYVGCVSGSQEDKSEVFPHHIAEGGVPIIDEAPVVMACTVEDVYETEGFESFICKIAATYAEETVLTPEGKIDYRILKPVLFEMPTYEYLKTGGALGKCKGFGTGQTPARPIFPLGPENTAYAQYFVGTSYLNMLTTQGAVIGNVTFEPGCRNNWHIHKASQGGGQILLVTDGRGWYQEWGKPAQALRTGDVVNIPAGVKHWHGAAKDSWFTHLAVEVAGENTSNEWLEPVNDAEYGKLP